MLTAPPRRPMSADIMRMWRADMATMPLPTDDPSRIELLRAAEELKAAAAALQARVTVAFDASQRAEQEAAGVDRRDLGRGIAAQVGLARRESPARGARDLGLARALVGELPHTLEALTFGTTTEWRATIIARETALLSREDRAIVDAELASRPGGLGALGDRAVESSARAISNRLDPYAATKRARKAETDRRVSLRPAPDTMSILTGLLPVRQGVAVFASLTARADSLRASGDARSRGQIMADTLVERLTGQATADAVPVEVQLVMTDQSLIDTNESDEQDEPGDRDYRASSASADLAAASASNDPDVSVASASDDPHVSAAHVSAAGASADLGVSADADASREPYAAFGAPVISVEPDASGDPRTSAVATPAARAHGGDPVTAGAAAHSTRQSATAHSVRQSAGGHTTRKPGSESAGTAAHDRPSRSADLREAPAWVAGYGPVPAPLARSWIRDTQAAVWVRRLYTDPATGVLAAMDSRRRTFTGSLRAFVVARDRVCRTPWCDAPIRHVDHIQRAADGGRTTGENGQGLCAACNLAREAPGWTATGTAAAVRTTTPTGQQHSSSPPTTSPPAHRAPPATSVTRSEFWFRDLVLIA